MLPDFYIQPVSIIVATIVSFIFGGIWHGPLFGNLWAELIGMDTSTPPKGGEISQGLLLTIVGNLLTSFVMAHVIQVVRPSSWGIEGKDECKICVGFVCALLAWLGGSIPLILNGVAWERRSWGLFFLNSTYAFFHLQIICYVLSSTS